MFHDHIHPNFLLFHHVQVDNAMSIKSEVLMNIIKSLTSYSIISGRRLEFDVSNLRADPGGGTESLRC
jgi:hypothetical protein